MIKIANAPCSWGVQEFDLEGKTSEYGQVLDEIRETGYQEDVKKLSVKGKSKRFRSCFS